MEYEIYCGARILMDPEEAEDMKEKLVTQNASMCRGIKIESIFWLSADRG